MQKKVCIDCSLEGSNDSYISENDSFCEICGRQMKIYTIRGKNSDKTNELLEKICVQIGFDYKQNGFKFHNGFSSYFYKNYSDKINLSEIVENNDFINKYKLYYKNNDINVKSHIEYTYDIYI